MQNITPALFQGATRVWFAAFASGVIVSTQVSFPLFVSVTVGADAETFEAAHFVSGIVNRLQKNIPCRTKDEYSRTRPMFSDRNCGVNLSGGVAADKHRYDHAIDECTCLLWWSVAYAHGSHGSSSGKTHRRQDPLRYRGQFECTAMPGKSNWYVRRVEFLSKKPQHVDRPK